MVLRAHSKWRNLQYIRLSAIEYTGDSLYPTHPRNNIRLYRAKSLPLMHYPNAKIYIF